jgi:hypothetical protein
VLGLVGIAGVGLAIAPALQVLTIPIAILGAAFLARAWWLQLSQDHDGKWATRSLITLIVSTTAMATLWSLRFTGVIGA